LDLLPQARQRSPADAAERVGIAPLEPTPARAERAFDQPAGCREANEHRFDRREREAEPRRDVARRERSVRPPVALDQIAERVIGGLEERRWESRRQRRAERIAVSRRVFDGDDALIAADWQFDGPPGVDERRDS